MARRNTLLRLPDPAPDALRADDADTDTDTDTHIPWARPVLFGDEKDRLEEALASTAISGGPFVTSFERAFGELHGVPAAQALCVSNGTAALQLPLLALGIGPGDEVIVPGWGFCAAANMVLACGARPVFADVTDDGWLLDPEDVERRVTARTRAVVAIHTYGSVCDMAALGEIARRHGLTVIEDCAESVFSRRDGRPCGALGDVGTFSFQATKTITCGEGGLVMARDPALCERMALIRSHGMNGEPKYWHHVVGHNFRLTNLQAAVLCAQFGHREEIARMRARLYAAYRLRLEGRAGLRLQRLDPAVEPVMWALGVRVDPAVHRVARDEIMRRMAARGIETRPGFYSASEQPLYATPPLGRAERIAAEVICLPAPAQLSARDVDRVCDAFLAVLGVA